MLDSKKIIDIGSDQEWFWSKEWQKDEKRASDDIASGKVKSFDSVDDFAKELESLK